MPWPTALGSRDRHGGIEISRRALPRVLSRSRGDLCERSEGRARALARAVKRSTISWLGCRGRVDLIEPDQMFISCERGAERLSTTVVRTRGPSVYRFIEPNILSPYTIDADLDYGGHTKSPVKTCARVIRARRKAGLARPGKGNPVFTALLNYVEAPGSWRVPSAARMTFPPTCPVIRQSLSRHLQSFIHPRIGRRIRDTERHGRILRGG